MRQDKWPSQGSLPDQPSVAGKSFGCIVIEIVGSKHCLKQAGANKVTVGHAWILVVGCIGGSFDCCNAHSQRHSQCASVGLSVCVCVCLFVSDSVELCFGVQCVCVIVYVFQCVCASISVSLAPVCVRQIVASLTFASHSMAAPLRLRQFCQTRFRDILLLLVSMVFFDRNINSEKTSNVCTFRWLPYMY